MSTKQKNLKALLGTAVFALMFGPVSVHAADSGSGKSDTSGASGATGGTAGSSAKTSGASASAGKSSDVAMSRADKIMMKDLAAANMAEMKAAQVALDKSKDDQVQDFAQKMLDDHTKAHEKLRDLAQIKNVDLPTNLDGKHQKELEKLSSLSGDKFDKRYLQRGGVADHKEAMQLIERIEKRAEDPQLQALATDLKPTIRDHHQLATKMVKRDAATTSGSSGATSDGSSSGSSSSGSSASSAGSSKDESGKVKGPTRTNDIGVMDSPNSRAIRKGSESRDTGSATQGK